jgi:UDP-glucose 4-epimerase
MAEIKKVLITGACGYLGANIANIMAGNGFEVTAFDIAMPGHNQLWEKKMSRIILGDIRDPEVLAKLGKIEFDAIIHLISLDHNASKGAPGDVADINVIPAWNLLNLFANKNLKTFIYFSTQQVLGKIPVEEIDENTSPLPLNQYGLTHLLCEHIVSYYDRITDINCINIRLSNGYGPPVFKENNCWWLVVNDLCRTAFEKGKIILLSDGSPQRDFIYIEDIGRAIISILGKNDNSVKTINIGSGETHTILELALMVKKVYHKIYSREIEIILGDGRIISEEVTLPQAEKFQWNINNLSGTGFKTETTLEEGIENIFKFLES